MDDDAGMSREDEEEDDPNVCDCGAYKPANEDWCWDCMEEAAHRAKCDRQQRPY